MPVQALAAATPAAPSLREIGIGTGGGGPARRCARSLHAGGAAFDGLVLRSTRRMRTRGPREAPAGSRDAVAMRLGSGARTQQQADWLPVRGLRGAIRKRWVVQASDSEQSQEIVEKNNTQSSEENSGPPVLTIIAGLLVLVVVFWTLGSLVSWIVGLLFKS